MADEITPLRQATAVKVKPFTETPTEQRRKQAIEQQHLAQISETAREYAHFAVETLVDIMNSSDSDHCRIAACNIIIDRGFGKAMSPKDAPDDTSNTKGGAESPSNKLREYLGRFRESSAGAGESE